MTEEQNKLYQYLYSITENEVYKDCLGSKMKKIIFLLLIFTNTFVWSQQFIKVTFNYELKDGNLDSTEFKLDFDNDGYLTKYLSIRHVSGETIEKEIIGKKINDDYELTIDIRNDIDLNPHNLNVTYLYKKTNYGWDKYNLKKDKLLQKIHFDYNPNLEIYEEMLNGDKNCIFKQKANSIMLYNNEYKLLNGFFIKQNLDVNFGEKVIFNRVDKNIFLMNLCYEGRKVQYKIESNYECKNVNQIALLYTLINWDVPEELMPFIVVYRDANYYATSYLTEGKTTYEPEHLQEKGGLPWASGNGKGIGEVISIKDYEHKNPRKLVIMNGYQDKKHPDYYEKNSRVKTMRITSTRTKKSKKITVKDIKEEQCFSLAELGEGNEYEFEILDVYDGNKYADLCIQYLVVE